MVFCHLGEHAFDTLLLAVAFDAAARVLQFCITFCQRNNDAAISFGAVNDRLGFGVVVLLDAPREASDVGAAALGAL